MVSYTIFTDQKIEELLKFKTLSDLIDNLNYRCYQSHWGVVINKPALGMRIWMQSSVIAVLTLFCSLVWLASQLAKELAGKRARECLLWNQEKENTDGPSLKLQNWMNQFNILYVFVENIDSVFSPILVLAIFLKMIRFSDHFYQILVYFSSNSTNSTWDEKVLHWFSNRGVFFFNDSLSLFMIAFVSQQFENKVQLITR